MRFRCEGSGAWVQGGPSAKTTSAGKLECAQCGRTYGQKANMAAAYGPRMEHRRAQQAASPPPPNLPKKRTAKRARRRQGGSDG